MRVFTVYSLEGEQTVGVYKTINDVYNGIEKFISSGEGELEGIKFSLDREEMEKIIKNKRRIPYLEVTYYVEYGIGEVRYDIDYWDI